MGFKGNLAPSLDVPSDWPGRVHRNPLGSYKLLSNITLFKQQCCMSVLFAHALVSHPAHQVVRSYGVGNSDNRNKAIPFAVASRLRSDSTKVITVRMGPTTGTFSPPFLSLDALPDPPSALWHPTFLCFFDKHAYGLMVLIRTAIRYFYYNDQWELRWRRRVPTTRQLSNVVEKINP